MYVTLLWVHSWWRWVVLLFAVATLVHACIGCFGARPFTRRSRSLSAAYVGTLDLQLMVGTILYLFVSPLTSAAFADLGAAMRNPPLRFFAMEHGPTMLVGVALAHIGSARARKADTDVLRHRRLLVWQGIALVLMLAAVPWPWLDVGRPLFR